MTIPTEVVLPIVGNVVAICDADSVANSPEFMPRLLATAREEELGGHGLLANLWRTKLMPYCRAGDLAVWTTLVDGVFKIRLVLNRNASALPKSNDEFTCKDKCDPPFLRCISGSIVIAALSDLGSKKVYRLANVVPATYQLGLERDFDQEAMHAGLSGPEDYKDSDGPDWTVHLMSQL